MNTEDKELNTMQIMELLPHRYPFLYIDKILNYELGQSITAMKNVTINEPFFQGHFPNKPIMPGVLIIEAMAQATGILAFKSEVGRAEIGQIYMLVGVDKVRFKRIVEPGDQLEIYAEVVTVKRGMWKFSCTAKVEGELVTSADILCTQKKADS